MVVAGVHHQIRPQAGQRADPVDLLLLTGQQVQIGDVQHPDRIGTDRQHRYAELPQRVRPGLDQGAVTDAGRAGGEHSDAGPGQVAHGLFWPFPFPCPLP